MKFLAQHYRAYDCISAEEAIAKRNGSKAGDPVKGIKARYQLMVIKKLLLKVIVGANIYKAIMAKIKTYKGKYMRFEGVSNSTDVEGCKAPRYSWVVHRRSY